MLTNAIGWTLVQFLWQGAAIGAFTAIILAALRSRDARTRYAVATLGLTAMLVTSVGTAWRYAIADPVIPLTPHDMTAVPGVPAVSVASAAPAASAFPGSAVPAPQASPALPALLDPSAVPALFAPALIDRWLPAAVWMWLSGVLALSLNLLRSWLIVERIRHRATRPVPDACRNQAQRLAARLRISRPFQVLESTLVEVPAAVGWLCPVILLPASALTGLAPAQLTGILAHELAHIRRHDYLVNLLQSLVETLLFFHPAVWWVSRRIRVEREHCCDDVAVALCGDRMVYLTALMKVEQWRHSHRALALAATDGSLVKRVRRIVGVPASDAAPGLIVTTVMLTVLLAVAAAIAAGDTRVKVIVEGASPVAARVRTAIATGLDRAASTLIDPSGALEQSVPRDTSAVPPTAVATGSVRGRITGDAGEALYRVKVTLDGTMSNAPTAVTDLDGWFTVSGVRPGEYTVTAVRAGYLSGQFGQRRTGDAAQPIEVRSNETVSGIDLHLVKGAVIAGRILNEDNEPSPGVRVDALTLRYSGGRRAQIIAATATTNDIGEFRISSLEPATYYIRAASGEIWGDEDEKKGTHAYAATFYPGVTARDRAQAVVLKPGEEIGNLDFSLSVGRVSRVVGVLKRSGGEPVAGQAVTLNRSMRNASAFFIGSGSAVTDAGGGFEFRDVPPGEYMLSAGSMQAEWAQARLAVEDTDLRGVSLILHRLVNGTVDVLTDEGQPPPFPLSGVRLLTVVTEDRPLPPGTMRAVAVTAATALPNPDAPFLLRLAGLPSDWMLKAVLVEGRDVTDTPFELVDRPASFQIVVTQRAARLTGQVSDAKGSADGNATVIVFSEDQRQWGAGSRFVLAVRANRDGRFTTGSLPPGRYLAVAREFVEAGQWEDREFLRTLVTAATAVQLNEGGAANVQLTTREQP